jgi:hypothetical protein
LVYLLTARFFVNPKVGDDGKSFQDVLTDGGGRAAWSGVSRLRLLPASVLERGIWGGGYFDSFLWAGFGSFNRRRRP